MSINWDRLIDEARAMESHDLIPADTLSEREQQCLRFAAMPTGLVPMERLELEDFLGYPSPMPQSAPERVEAVVLRILGARVRGEHIA